MNWIMERIGNSLIPCYCDLDRFIPCLYLSCFVCFQAHVSSDRTYLVENLIRHRTMFFNMSRGRDPHFFCQATCAASCHKKNKWVIFVFQVGSNYDTLAFIPFVLGVKKCPPAIKPGNGKSMNIPYRLSKNMRKSSIPSF